MPKHLWFIDKDLYSILIRKILKASEEKKKTETFLDMSVIDLLNTLRDQKKKTWLKNTIVSYKITSKALIYGVEKIIWVK